MEIMVFKEGSWRIESCEPPKTRDYSKLVEAAQSVLMVLLSDTEKEGFDERAAIMEYDGRLSREEAEKAALRLILSERFKN